MPTEHFSVEEYFRGELINWDAIRQAQSYREPRWRTSLRNLKAWFTKAFHFSKPGDKKPQF